MINENLIKELLGNEVLTAKEIIEKGNIRNITPQGLAKKLSSYYDIDVICNTSNGQRKSNTYKVIVPTVFTGEVTKDKNILILKVTEGDNLVYDFNKKEFVGRKPSKRVSGVGANPVLRIFCDSCYRGLRTTEWLYNYMDLLDEPFKLDGLQRSTCPKGYINWLKETNQKINVNTLKKYNIMLKFPNLASKLLDKILSDYRYCDTQSTDKYIEIYSILYDKCNLDKLIRNSIKNFDWNISEQVIDLVNYIVECNKHEISWLNYIDSNRDLRHNINTLKTIINEKKYAHLGENLRKLNFINDLEVGEYVVVVPQNVNDLVNEGQQQNNCVGSYYNTHIERGTDLIYFLRYKDNKEKSVVTCRYNIVYHTTVEARIKNNSYISNEQGAIINDIDKIINQNLGK